MNSLGPGLQSGGVKGARWLLIPWGLGACVSPGVPSLPEPPDDAITAVLGVRDGEDVRGFFFPVGSLPPAPFDLRADAEVAIAYFRSGHPLTVFARGELVRTGDRPLRSLMPPAQVHTAIVGRDGGLEWGAAGDLPPYLAALSAPPQACGELWVDPDPPTLPETHEGAEVGHLAGLAVRKDGALLVATGQGLLATVVGPSITLSRASILPKDYSAVFQDGDDIYLTGNGPFLDRLRGDAYQRLLPVPSELATNPVHMDGGRSPEHPGLQLMAIGPWPRGAENERSLYTWDEGAPAWRTTSLKGEIPCSEVYECDSWRVTWLGPDRALLLNRTDKLLWVEGGAVQPIVLADCDRYTAAHRLENGRALVACQGPLDNELLVEFSPDGVAGPRMAGLDPDGRGVSATLVMLEAEGELWLGGTDGAFGRPGRTCPPYRLAGEDLASMLYHDGAVVTAPFKYKGSDLVTSSGVRRLRRVRLGP